MNNVESLTKIKLFLKNFKTSIVSLEDIAAVERRLGTKLPSDYVDVIREFNGGEGLIRPGQFLCLWKIQELEELNRGYAVNEFAPGLTIFGSDGGGTAYGFISTNGELAYVETPFIGMSQSSLKSLGSNFFEFLKSLAKGLFVVE